MLIEFSVENYKSFRDKATLSMVASRIKSEDPALDKDAVIPVSPDLELLRCAGIYGANSSGKSNLVAAMRFMSDFIRDSSRETNAIENIKVEPFMLSVDTIHKPSLFEIVFLLDKVQYRYGFEVTSKEVVAEWLFSARKKKETNIFTRSLLEINLHEQFAFEASGLKERTRGNSLFLSVVAQFNGKLALAVSEWFSRFWITTGLTDQFRYYTTQCLRNTLQKPPILALLRQLDLGFSDLEAPEPPGPNDFPENMSEVAKKVAIDSFSNRIFSVHSVTDVTGAHVHNQLFDTEVHESQGTQKLIALAGLISFALTYTGICVIDELDARLHPLITRTIIQFFNRIDSNPNGAQLIFVTHDTNLLDKSFLRRDQIWFAEKDSLSSTHLVSLVEFKPRNDASYEKNYLQGRYGAIPYIGDIDRLPGANDAAETK